MYATILLLSVIVNAHLPSIKIDKASRQDLSSVLYYNNLHGEYTTTVEI